MMLSVHGDLDVVAYEARASAARRHRTGVRIGQRSLLVGRGQHLFLDRREALHLTFEFRELLLEPRRLERQRLGRLLSIGRVELTEIPQRSLQAVPGAAPPSRG
jgi:uncharacterized protein (UPF0548 family)